MNRLGQRLFNGLTAISLALAALAIAMGVISIRYGGEVLCVGRGTTLKLASYSGTINLQFWRTATSDQPRLSADIWKVPAGPWPGEFNFRTLGFAAGFRPPNVGWTAAGNPVRFLGTPYWAIAAIGAVPWIFRWVGMQKRKRRHNDRRCIHCGYDLRATPDRCPECGNVPTKMTSDSLSTDKSV
jgi:hypothetical protein